ncbi:MAG TPA: hypothetical protein VF254_09805 [Gammaproteobacteria bacterium]
MKNKALNLVLFTILGLTGCGSDRNDTGTLPAGEPPLANQPTGEPAPTPAEEDLPIEQLPVEDPVEIPADEPDPEEPFAALTLDPEIAAKGMAPNGEIVLFSDRPLDATAILLELRDGATTETVPADISFDDAAQTVTITPGQLLAEGGHYVVHLGTQAGAEKVVSSAAPVVVRVKQRLYSRFTSYDKQGSVNAIIEYRRIAGSSEALRTHFAGDGEIIQYEQVTFLPGNVEVAKSYISPGVNGLWFDQDDVLRRATRTTKLPDGRLSEELISEEPGPDGRLFTSDDTYDSARFLEYDSGGRLGRFIYREGADPGPDGIWLSQDDPVLRHVSYVYDLDGRLQYELSIDGTGSNSVTTSARSFEYDEYGRLSAKSVVTSSGENGLWFDGDDEIFIAYRHGHADETDIVELFYGGVAGLMDQYEYRVEDRDGRPLFEGTFESFGADGSWHTDDDWLDEWGARVYRYTYNENGMLEQRAFTILDNGPDAIRFSGDEITRSLFVRGYDDSSRLSYMRAYKSDGSTVDEWSDEAARLQFEYEYYDAEVEQ